MSRGKILDTYEICSSSLVKKSTPWGTFTGIALLHPNDEALYSKFLGYHIAEVRCDIEAKKAKIKAYKQRLKGFVEGITAANMADNPALIRQKRIMERRIQEEKILLKQMCQHLDEYIDAMQEAKQKSNARLEAKEEEGEPN